MKKFLVLIGILVFAGIGCSYKDLGQGKSFGKNKNNGRPNVIIFAFDGLQAKHLHAYGYEKDTTPNLDKFLADSYLFKNTVSPSSWTVPSFMSIFTSLYPSEHKVVNKFVEYFQVGTTTKAVKANLKQLDPQAVTLAEILKKNGYKTAGFTGDAGVSAAFGHAQGFDEYYDKDAFGGFDTSSPLAVDWLNKNKNSNFFLFLHGYDVHGQHAPREGFDYRYVNKPYNGKYIGSAKEQGLLREESLANGGLSLSDEDKNFWRAIYDEKISRADEEFGRFMDYLQKNDLVDNSIIIVLSDHGTEFFEHGGIDHGQTLYGELVDTLFAIHLPGQKSGKQINDLVSTLDLAPTLLNILNIKDPVLETSTPIQNRMKGINLVPAFSGVDVSHDVYSETDYRLYTHKRSITTVGGYRFIETMESGQKELYNLLVDPDEKNNIAEKEQVSSYELEQKLLKHLKDMKASDGPWPIGCLPVYGDQCQQLQTTTTSSTPAQDQKKNLSKTGSPNIIFINIDSLRADHIGAYGYKKNTTPFLDSLFKKGTIFENAITPAILTFQTDAAIFSGLYPSQNNVTSWSTPINDRLTLLPKILSAYGYSTAAFASPSLWEKFGFNKQFGFYKVAKDIKNIVYTKNEASTWVKKQKQPFFLFWHVYDAHLPFVSPNAEFYNKKYDGVFTDSKLAWIWEGQSRTSIGQRPPIDNSMQFANTSSVAAFVSENSHTFTTSDVEYLKAGYDSGVKYVDSELRKFFDSIKNEPWFKDAIIVVSSEHGDDLKEHGYIFHRDLYDVNTRVPLAIIGRGFPAKNINETVSSLDILPTLVKAIGGAEPANSEGINLTRIINGEILKRDIYTERPPYDEYAVRSGVWKYILRNPGKFEGFAGYDAFMQRMIVNETSELKDELYNLSTDPNEQNNLAGSGLAIEQVLRKKALDFKNRMNTARESNKNIQQFSPVGGKFIPYP